MPKVTVRGSVTPCVDLPTGEIRVYELTDQVRRRIKGGFYDLVSGDLDAAADQPEPGEHAEPRVTVHKDFSDAEGMPLPDDVEAYQEPAGNASRADWAAFLTARGVTVPDDAGRDDLREIWQQVDGGS